MRTTLFYLIQFIFVLSFAVSAPAHIDRQGQLLSIEKIYEAPAPIGRITLKYDGTDKDTPTLQVTSNLFRSKIPPQALTNLPRPYWDAISALYSLISTDPATGKSIDRPYLYISVPLHRPLGKSEQGAQVLFFFDEEGNLKERRLSQTIPAQITNTENMKIDVAYVLYENWPITSKETAEQVLTKAFENLEKENGPISQTNPGD